MASRAPVFARLLKTMIYETTNEGKVARITLNRPERGNGITLEMPRELSLCVEQANIDPKVHVIALAGNGSGFCGGYDLVDSAESNMTMKGGNGKQTEENEKDGKNNNNNNNNNDPNCLSPLEISPQSPVSPMKTMENHTRGGGWDPIVDYQVHRFCVAGGTDMALCSDLLVVDEKAKIGYPPARVWGTPTTSLWCSKLGHQRAMRLLLTGDCITGKQAEEWGLATISCPLEELDKQFEALLDRIAKVPINQLIMNKLLVNSAVLGGGGGGVGGNVQTLGVLCDGIARHTREGFEFQKMASEKGFREAVKARDEPFGDHGLENWKSVKSKL